LGRDILDKGRLALPDAFSFSFFGVEQYNGEWLADLLMYLSYDLFGLPGVYLFKLIIMSLVFYGLYRLSTDHFTKEQKGEVALAILSLVVVLFLPCAFGFLSGPISSRISVLFIFSTC
jgi:hypothetical protein